MNEIRKHYSGWRQPRCLYALSSWKITFLCYCPRVHDLARPRFHDLVMIGGKPIYMYMGVVFASTISFSLALADVMPSEFSCNIHININNQYIICIALLQGQRAFLQNPMAVAQLWRVWFRKASARLSGSSYRFLLKKGGILATGIGSWINLKLKSNIHSSWIMIMKAHVRWISAVCVYQFTPIYSDWILTGLKEFK